MPDYKKLGEIDVLIYGRATPESDRAVTAYLKAQKAKQARDEKPRGSNPALNKRVAKANAGL